MVPGSTTLEFLELLEASRGFFSRVLKPDRRLNQQFFPSHWDLGGAAVRFSRPRSTPGSLGRKGVWCGRESGADGSMGRKGAWGGREPGAEGAWGGREAGADGSMGRNGVWGGLSMGGKGAWGGRESLSRSMGRKGVWGARYIPAHHPPLAPSSYDISQPAGRHLPYWTQSLPLKGVRDKFNHNHSNLSVGRSKPLGAMRSPSAARQKTLKKLVAIAATLLVVSAGADVPLEGSG